MPQGISPNPLNKISEVYLSQISEHHKKDADGNTIPHEGEEVEEGAGLYANIHAKRKRGGKMRKKGDKGAPSSQDFANAARTAKEETEIGEAKVDTGRSDYGKASIRNYRRMGPGHGEPGMFDPEGKRGKTIDKRREEHKARRGVKGAKVPAYKVEEVEVDEAMAMKPSNMKKKAKLGAALDRLQALKVAQKKKEMGEEIENEGMQYGIFKGDGKPKGAMAAFGKKKNGMVHKHKHEMPHSKKITVKMATMYDVIVNKYGLPHNAYNGKLRDAFEAFGKRTEQTSAKLARDIALALDGEMTPPSGYTKTTRSSSTYAVAVEHADMFAELGLPESERSYTPSRGGQWRVDFDAMETAGNAARDAGVKASARTKTPFPPS